MGNLARIQIDIDSLKSALGFGVAGNFAGHLEQAGEASDFVNVAADSSQLPKGIFPWYVPGSDTFLGTFPLSANELRMPQTVEAQQRIQIEPELAVLCDVVRSANGVVETLQPRWVAAFDDCSQRRDGASRISEKKNWGSGSKGLASSAFAMSDLDPAGAASTLRLASFLRRGGEMHVYGVDSQIPTYTLFGRPLIEWLVGRLRDQRGEPGTPLEDVGALLDTSGCSRVVIGVGATRYEPFGEANFVAPGDEAIVVLYDSAMHSPDHVRDRIAANDDEALTAASVLRRTAH